MIEFRLVNATRPTAGPPDGRDLTGEQTLTLHIPEDATPEARIAFTRILEYARVHVDEVLNIPTADYRVLTPAPPFPAHGVRSDAQG